MQKSRDAERHSVGGLEEIAALEDVRFARLGAGFECKRSRAVRPLCPELLDLLVRFLELRLRRSPVREDGGNLRRRTLLARNVQNLANAFRQRVGGDWAGVCGHRNAEAAE